MFSMVRSKPGEQISNTHLSTQPRTSVETVGHCWLWREKSLCSFQNLLLFLANDKVDYVSLEPEHMHQGENKIEVFSWGLIWLESIRKHLGNRAAQ